ncbi:LysR family transcriptional regulator, partial [Salmonella enterica subsp. enterica serovar Kentucky]|nr:LysR family transcriptional regulator [Salmonella enterica subsp. enterica serovar Kentucky]
LIVLDADELVIPIQAYAYRMNTRMSQVAETFWRDLRGLQAALLKIPRVGIFAKKG